MASSTRRTGASPRPGRAAPAWRAASLVATIDSDLQYQPEDLLRLRRALYDYSVDVVQGWRSWVGRRKDERYHISRGFNFLLNTAFGMELEDNKSGFVLCAREVFQDLLTYKGSYFYWQSFIMVAAHAKGYSYQADRDAVRAAQAGQSFLDKKALQRQRARASYDLGKAVWEYRARPRPPDVAHQFLRRHPVIDRCARSAIRCAQRSGASTWRRSIRRTG